MEDITNFMNLPTKSICLSTALPALPATVPVLIPSRRTLPVVTTYNKYLSRLKDTHLSKVFNALKIIEIRLRTWNL